MGVNSFLALCFHEVEFSEKIVEYKFFSAIGISSTLEDWKIFLTKTLTGALASPLDLFREVCYTSARIFPEISNSIDVILSCFSESNKCHFLQ